MYSLSVKLNSDFETTVQRVTAALQQEKMGILNEINVDTVLKNKLNVEMPRYRILNVCSPTIGHRLVSADPDIGALLPCNVLVREEYDGTTTVIFMDPVTVFGLSQNEEVIAIAQEAKAMLMRAKAAL